MTTILIAILLALLLALAFFLFFRPQPRKALETKGPDPAPAGRTCPLCGSPLVKGQTVKSVVFATQTRDKIMEISGCPHCWSDSGERKTVPRFCPVCKKELRAKEVVTARVFERKEENKKTHVHVLGCPRCRDRG